MDTHPPHFVHQNNVLQIKIHTELEYNVYAMSQYNPDNITLNGCRFDTLRHGNPYIFFK